MVKKIWYTAKELIGLQGMPTSPQGINLMARREGWQSRRKRGVQGKALEYHVSSLPDGLFERLHETDNEYLSQIENSYLIWRESYYQLTKFEKERIIAFILRYGLSALVELIDNQTLIGPRINNPSIEKDYS